MRPRKEHQPLLQEFSSLCKKAYGSWHLVANPVLAKVCLSDIFLEYSTGEVPSRQSKWLIMRKVVQYYFVAVVNFFWLLCCKIAHALSGQRITISKEKTVFIDSYLVVRNILQGEDILSNYFPGINLATSVAGWDHIILARFHETNNPFLFYKACRIMHEKRAPVLSEFQLLVLGDYLLLLWHLLLYPWLVLKLLREIPCTREGLYIKFALVDGLSANSLLGAVRYLIAFRLAPLIPENARCLQWFENQTFERCFNRGLRAAGANMPIYGAQLFLWPPEIMNLHVDATEIAAHKPDVLLVNGPYFKHERIDIPCRTGPSIRYARVFESVITNTEGEKILILLPYFEDAARYCIELAVQIDVPEKLMFKFHPAAPLSHFSMLIPAASEVVDRELYDLFQDVDYVIGAASGSLVEAAVSGIPVIVVCKEGMVDYAYLPSIGRGLLWERVSNVKEMLNAKDTLFSARLLRRDEIATAIERIKRELFMKPTINAIIDSLELSL